MLLMQPLLELLLILKRDKTGTLTLNKLSVDKNLIEVFAKGVDKEQVLLFAAMASRTENHDAIDSAIVGTLADLKEARAGIREVHFLPFNPVDKRTALTYIDKRGNWHRTSKGAPEQILFLCGCKEDLTKKVHAMIDKFADNVYYRKRSETINVVLSESLEPILKVQCHFVGYHARWLVRATAVGILT